MGIWINPVTQFELAELYVHANTTSTSIPSQNTWVTVENLLEGNGRTLEYHNDNGDTYIKIPSNHAGNIGLHGLLR